MSGNTWTENSRHLHSHGLGPARQGAIPTIIHVSAPAISHLWVLDFKMRIGVFGLFGHSPSLIVGKRWGGVLTLSCPTHGILQRKAKCFPKGEVRDLWKQKPDTLWGSLVGFCFGDVKSCDTARGVFSEEVSHRWFGVVWGEWCFWDWFRILTCLEESLFSLRKTVLFIFSLLDLDMNASEIKHNFPCKHWVTLFLFPYIYDTYLLSAHCVPVLF